MANVSFIGLGVMGYFKYTGHQIQRTRDFQHLDDNKSHQDIGYGAGSCNVPTFTRTGNKDIRDHWFSLSSHLDAP